MNVLNALINLRNDLKTWVSNNLKQKSNVNHNHSEYLSNTGGAINGDLKVTGGMESTFFKGTNGVSIRLLPPWSYANFGTSTSNTDFYKNFLKIICSEFPTDNSVNYLARCAPNSQMNLYGSIYNNSSVNSDGLPQYSQFFGLKLDGTLVTFGTVEYYYYEYNLPRSFSLSGTTLTINS